jgi:four helix bundle protein
MEKCKELDAWKRARNLSLGVLRALRGVRQPEMWALVDQLRRAAISVETNVVEGYSLHTTSQFVRHLNIALGSVAEVKCLVELAAEMGYLPATVTRDLMNKAKPVRSRPLRTQTQAHRTLALLSRLPSLVSLVVFHHLSSTGVIH